MSSLQVVINNCCKSSRQHEFSFEENAVRSGTKVYKMKVINVFVISGFLSFSGFSSSSKILSRRALVA